MPDQDSNDDPDSRSILDPGNSDDQNSDASATRSGDSSASSEPAGNKNSSFDELGADPSASSGDASADGSEADAVDDLHFEDENLAEKLRTSSDEQLDNAPFGIIQVDDEGTVEFFNQYEAELSGMDPDEVVGRNFFTQVAPCTNNRLFRGRFKKGVRRGELDEAFTYTYTYKMRPTLVDVHLFRDEDGNNWITVQKY